MRKTLAVILFAALAFGPAGCGWIAAIQDAAKEAQRDFRGH